MSIIFQILGWILLLVSLPAVVELSLFLVANLFLRFRLKRGARADARTAVDRIAVLVPAHDEERNIERCVASLLASEFGHFQRDVFVIADNCADRTAELARHAGSRVIERFDSSVRGKGAALNYAFTLLASEGYGAYLVVDADSVVAPDFIRVMGEQFERGRDALQCVYLVRNVDAAPRMRLMNLSLLSMNYLRPLGREILGCSVGILGNGFGLTKELLDAVPYTANSITEDLEYHHKLIEKGYRAHFVRDTRVLADFPVSREGGKTQRARWEGGRFRLQRTLSWGLLKKILSGRLSLVEPFLELMSMPLSYEVLVLLALVVLPHQPFLGYAAAGLAVIFLQVVASVLLFGNRRDFLAFFQVPGYVAWKLLQLPGILKSSRKDARWVRTNRD